MIPNAISHHPLMGAIPEQQLEPPGQFLPLYIVCVMLYVREYPFHQFRSAVLTVFSPGFLCCCSFTEHGKLKNLAWLRVSIAEQQLKHLCIINIIVTLNLKTVPATGKKSNSALAEN